MTPEEWKRRGQEAAEQARQMQRRAQMHESASCLPLTPPPLTRRPAPPEPPCGGCGRGLKKGGPLRGPGGGG